MCHLNLQIIGYHCQMKTICAVLRAHCLFKWICEKKSFDGFYIGLQSGYYFRGGCYQQQRSKIGTRRSLTPLPYRETIDHVL